MDSQIKKMPVELITPINQDVVVAFTNGFLHLGNYRYPCTRRLVLYFAPHAGRDDQNDIQELSEGRMEAVHATVLQAIQNLVDFRIGKARL